MDWPTALRQLWLNVESLVPVTTSLVRRSAELGNHESAEDAEQQGFYRAAQSSERLIAIILGEHRAKLVDTIGEDRTTGLEDDLELTMRVASEIMHPVVVKEINLGKLVDNSAGIDFRWAAVAGRLEQVAQRLRKCVRETPPLPEGPDPPYFRIDGKEYRLEMPAQQWKILGYVWNKERVELAALAKAVFGRRRQWKQMKAPVSKLSSELAANEIRYLFSKPTRADYLLIER